MSDLIPDKGSGDLLIGFQCPLFSQFFSLAIEAIKWWSRSKIRPKRILLLYHSKHTKHHVATGL